MLILVIYKPSTETGFNNKSIMEENAENYLKDLYYNLNNPESYLSIRKVFLAGKKRFPRLNKKDVEL